MPSHHLSDVLSSPKNNSLMLLRMLAAISIVVTHAFPFSTGQPDFLYQLTQGQVDLSYLGLAVFFLLSGMLVMQSLHQSASIKDFIWRRCRRIYPGFVVVILVVAIVMGPIFTSLNLKAYFSHTGFFEYLGGISIFRLRYALPGIDWPDGVNGALWTINLEVKLYLMLVALALFRWQHNKWLVGGLLVAQLLVHFFWSRSVEHWLLHFGWNVNMHAYNTLATYFLFGNFLFLIGSRLVWPRWLLWPSLLLAATSLYFHFFKQIDIFIVVVFVLAFASNTTLISLSSRLRNDYSYGIYLYAFAVQISLAHLFPTLTNPWLFALVSLASVFPFAWVSWHFIEKYWLKKK
jgi:peptidoglycan/LPS O-acetylase OafA/YrhL